MITITVTVLCEGATEFNFVRNTLKPYLAPRRIFLRAIDMRGSVSPRQLRTSVQDETTAGRRNEYVTTMIDLYGLRAQLGSIGISGESCQERVVRLEDDLKQHCSNANFIPYIQLHEFEALVLVDVDIIADQFPEDRLVDGIKYLKRSIGAKPPEDVDDGEQTSPSKRIIKSIPQYKARKHEAGPAIAQAIGIDRLRQTCPHFDEWITKLERLAE